MSDEVWLEIPAQPEFVFLARVTAAKLAARQGFTFDEIEDLRLAIDEILACLIGISDPAVQVRIRFLDTDPGLRVSGFSERRGEGDPTLNEMSQLILNALVDEHSVGETDGNPSFDMLKKHVGV